MSGTKGAEVSLRNLFFFTCTDQNDRKVLPAMLEQQDLMCAQRFGALVIEKAMYKGVTDPEASEKAEVRAGGGNSGSKEARGVPQSEAQLLVPCPDGVFGGDPGVRDGEEMGGGREDGSGLGEADEVD